MKVADRITSEDDLVNVGVTGLKIPYHKIKSALTNHPKDIQSATHDVLYTWVKSQLSRAEAFEELCTALRKCEMNLLATELETWANKEDTPNTLCEERRYNLDYCNWQDSFLLLEQIGRQVIVLVYINLCVA